jgi:hypothetical protein
MAIKINKPIGTDRGITSEAYVRVVNYTISKLGYARFDLEIFLSEEDAKSSPTPYGTGHASPARSQEIGYELSVQLMENKLVMEKQVTHEQVDVTEERLVEGSDPEEYETVVVGSTMVAKEIDVEVERMMPTLAPIEEAGLFAFAYAKLKEKLDGIYGEAYVLNV